MQGWTRYANGFGLFRRLLVAMVLIVVSDSARAQSIDATDSSTTHDDAAIRSVLPTSLFLSPRFARLDYQHVTGLSRWGAYFISHPSGVFDSLRKSNYFVELNATSRYRETDLNLTTEASGLFTGSYSPAPLDKWSLFFSLAGTSYISNTPAGSIPSPILITHATDGFGVAGAHAQIPGTDILVSAGGGIARQTQPNASGYGSIVRADFYAPNEIIADASTLDAYASGDERFFAQRDQRYSNDSARIHTLTYFGTNTPGINGRNDALLVLGLLRRDFFYPIDSASAPVKQERREMSLLFCDTLSYPIMANHIQGSIDATAEPRSVLRTSDATTDLVSNRAYSGLSSLLAPNQISGLRLSAGARLDLANLFARDASSSRNGLSGQVSARFEEKDENVVLLSENLHALDPASIKQLATTLDQASYSSRTTTAGMSLRYAPDETNTIEGETNARLFSYDTPNPLNHDDRDELIASARIAYHRTFTSRLSGGLELRGSRNHLVYLASDHSAQNSVTRGLALASDGVYAGESLYQSLRGEVFSNYTLLDYLDEFPLLSGIGSYVLRGLSIRDSTRIDLGLHPVQDGGLKFVCDFELRDYERGEWQSATFTERRNAANLEVAGEAFVELEVQNQFSPWQLRLGVRGFLLSRSGLNEGSLAQNGNYEEIERQSRIGPLVECKLLRAGDSGPTLSASFWYALLAIHNFVTDSWTHDRSVESSIVARWNF